MPQQTVTVKSPLRGINRAFGREDQPDSTVWDALNVLPFDRTGRLRAGQRSGTAKLWAAALGAPSTVQMLQQTTIALDPATVTADVSQFSEDFTAQVVGTNVGNIGGAGVRWHVSQSTNTGIAAATDVTRLQVKTVNSTAVAAYNGSVNAAAGVVAPTLTLGSAYVLRATAFQANASGGGSAAAIMLHSRVNLSTYADTSVRLHFWTDRVELFDGTSTTSFTFSPALSGTALHTIELRVNGDVFQAWVNGVMYATLTTSVFNTQVGVGFGVGSTGTAAHGVATFNVFSGKQLASYRQTNIVAVSNGAVYQGDIATQAALVTGGSGQLLSSGRPQSAFSAGKMYFVDGYVIRRLNLTTRAMETYTATAGTAPTNCTLACMWRDRLVLAAPRDTPQNFFFSRVGTHTDWDYSVVNDPAVAFAGNASTSGRIGEPIVALIPASDDVLYIGGDHCLWAVRGDPADGGSIDLISDAIGVLGPNAWCKSPDGTLYFVGTGGLFKLTRDGGLENISLTAYPQFFSNIDRGQNYVQMAWDRDRHGAFVFVSPVNTGAATHLWYDQRTESFWPLQYPDSHGPISCLVYDGDAATDRVLLLGGRTGYVQQVSATNRNDDGTAMLSYVTLGPFNPAGDLASLLVGTDIDFGELATADQANPSRWGVTVTLLAGMDAYSVTEGQPHSTVTIDCPIQRRQKTLRQRLRGGWFAMKFANQATGNYWAFETASMMFEEAGKNRARH
jgi:hypothetical protein